MWVEGELEDDSGRWGRAKIVAVSNTSNDVRRVPVEGELKQLSGSFVCSSHVQNVSDSGPKLLYQNSIEVPVLGRCCIKYKQRWETRSAEAERWTWRRDIYCLLVINLYKQINKHAQTNKMFGDVTERRKVRIIGVNIKARLGCWP